MIKFSLRYKPSGPHVRIRMFGNGALLGNLTMTTEEWIAFVQMFQSREPDIVCISPDPRNQP